jgi:hypothetical protein
MHIRRRRPASWRERKQGIVHLWALPFWAVEWVFEWVAYLLDNWTFLEVLEYFGSFSVLVGVLFYFSESGDRIKQKHYQAWQVVNTAQGKGGNGGRVEALEELSADGIALVGVDVAGAFLQGIRLPRANLLRSNFSNADIRQADFTSAIFDDANLHSANFRSSSLRNCSFRGADLDETDLSGAELAGTDFSGATLVDADLRDANLDGIRWNQIRDIKKANIKDVRNAPRGFVAWALRQGAVQTE